MIGVDDSHRRSQVERLVGAYGPDVDGLCRACLTAIPGIGGVGVTIMSPNAQLVRFASDVVNARVEQLQFLLGEGPCRDAFATAGPVLAGDLRDRDWQNRWPAFAPAAVLAGAHAVFALPLQVGPTRVGVLDLYRDTAGDLHDDALSEAILYADAVTDLLLAETAAQADDDFPVDSDSGSRGLLQRAAVNQATGMVRVQLRVTVEDALTRLRAYAFAAGRELDEVAAEVIARRLRFDDSDEDEDR